MAIGSDCEIIRSGLLDQPVNALSALAFVAVAVVIRRRPVLAVLSAAAGIGSFAYHGFGGDVAQWAHDVSVFCLIVGITYEHRVMLVLTAGVVAGLAFWALPPIADVLTVAVALNGVAALAHRGSLASPRALLALVVLVTAAVVNSLSRTGQPWCDPESLLQGHGLWHVGTAVALYLWSRASNVRGQSRKAATSNSPST